MSHAAAHERIPTTVLPHAADVSRAVAGEIASLIRTKASRGERTVLGLATGSTPTGVYAELVRMHRDDGLSFKNVVTFNLDEYLPMQPGELQSYVRFMREHLFDHIDINPKHAHVPDGTLSPEEVPAFCDAYERAIREAGGVDLQILGIGRTGHIGFNEPGSERHSRTRMIWLDKVTRIDAASDFFGVEYVPQRAITMGVGTILEAKRVIMMAFGENKAPVVARAIEGTITNTIAASFLQEHVSARVYLDDAAAAQLTRCKAPWLLGKCEFTPAMVKKAAIWLAAQVNKPLLKLTDEDYNEHGLQALVAEQGPAYTINIRVFRGMQRTITGWPAGKPRSAAADEFDVRVVDDREFKKRVIIFSPHPDDDVISMGGTLIRLADQGHDVHVAYQTSGNIAVFDDEALRYADFVTEFARAFGLDKAATDSIEERMEQYFKAKKPGQIDPPEVQQIKGLIRRSEARAGARYCGVPNERLHFLDLPFYETGAVRKKPLGEADIQIVAELLERVEPHQIYAAGDLSDPHGTHRVCLEAILHAVGRLQSRSWMKQCEVWLYRGAWQEWEAQDVEMAVPLSPGEVARKRNAIFKHQSQKDRALFPGSDEREFWQRAEARNRQTAELYDALGLAEYEAIEGFVQWRPANVSAGQSGATRGAGSPIASVVTTTTGMHAARV
jgi:glucosamine-6-phosphate deaminase